MISWISNKTFPKSLDVSKAIDKAAGAEREVVGTQTLSGNAAQTTKEKGGTFASNTNSVGVRPISVNITAPSTPEAQKWQGWGTGLKPTVEPIVMARKPLIGTVAANVLEHGTGALNIDGSRIGTSKDGDPNRFLNTKGFSSENVYAQDNWTQNNSKGVTVDLNQGRWPANVILDEYSAGELDEQSGTLKSGAHIKDSVISDASTKTPSSFISGMSGKTRSYRSPANTGGASRFFYCAKASKRDRNEGLEGLEAKDTSGIEAVVRGDGTRGTARQNFHPTVKPTNLMRYLVKLVTPPGGTVLDPFTGSGSTGKAAILEGFEFIGIEMTEEYLPIIDARLKHAEQVRDQQEQAKDEGLF
jgi:hypothetical protein